MSIEIRFATVDDVPLILSFIKKLAEYQKLAHEVVATEKLLSENLFGEKKYAEVILAYVNDSPAGFALFFYNFSTFLGKPFIYLEDLYVNSEMRGQGVGVRLLSFLANLALERNCEKVEWCVLDWNTSAIKLYKKIGAKIKSEWVMHFIAEKKLNDLAKLFKH